MPHAPLVYQEMKFRRQNLSLIGTPRGFREVPPVAANLIQLRGNYRRSLSSAWFRPHQFGSGNDLMLIPGRTQPGKSENTSFLISAVGRTIINIRSRSRGW
jgi:hypothetical protein